MRTPFSVPLQPSGRTERRPSGMRINVGMRDVRSVYLGGNITRNDWRRTLVAGLGVMGVAPAYPTAGSALWPTLPAAVIGRFDYVGPYSISGDPSDDAEWNNDSVDPGTEWVFSGPLYAPQRGPRVSNDLASPYGPRGGQTQPALTQTTASQEVWWPLVRAARQFKRLTLDALRQSDLYFAWLDTPLCASTLTEIGWAQAKGKIIWLAGPQAFDELWLAYTVADQYSFRYPAPADAFQSMVQLALSSAS